MAKEFSNKEKALIKQIYYAKDSHNYILTNVFAEWLYEKPGVCFDLEKGCLIFDYTIYKSADNVLIIKKAIINTALLVKYLEENSYIYIIQDKTTIGELSCVGATNIMTPLRVDVPEEISTIIKRSLGTITVSQSLISLVENDFKTNEEKQNQYVIMDKPEINVNIDKSNVAIGSIGGNNSGTVDVSVNNEKQNKNNWKKNIGWSIAVALFCISVFLFSKEYSETHDLMSVITSDWWVKWLTLGSAILIAIVSPLLKSK